MKNIVCPISTERVHEHLPRVSALFVISLLSIYLITGFLPILVFLLADFIARGTGYSRFSIVHLIAVGVSKGLNLKSELIDKAPKLFAARLGAVMMGVAVLLDIASLSTGAHVIAFAVVFFAALECVANFCVGCYVYSLVVFPLYSKKG